MTSKLETFLQFLQRVFEAQGFDPHDARRAALAALPEIERAPPTPPRAEVQRARSGIRALELLGQGTCPEDAARRLQCSRAALYRRAKQAMRLKRIA